MLWFLYSLSPEGPEGGEGIAEEEHSLGLQ
jgi:hypothetical protein